VPPADLSQDRPAGHEEVPTGAPRGPIKNSSWLQVSRAPHEVGRWVMGSANRPTAERGVACRKSGAWKPIEVCRNSLPRKKRGEGVAAPTSPPKAGREARRASTGHALAERSHDGCHRRQDGLLTVFRGFLHRAEGVRPSRQRDRVETSSAQLDKQAPSRARRWAMGERANVCGRVARGGEANGSL